MANPVSTKAHKGIKIEKPMTHGSWRGDMAHLQEPHGEVKVGCRPREQCQEGAHTFIRVPWVEFFEVPRGYGKTVGSNKTEWGFC